ncbi:MAG: YIP1 family protein [Chloroflexales bacterium]
MATVQQSSLPEMLVQSRELMQNPSVPVFEHYEQRGTITNAAIYVGVAALIAAALGFIGGINGLISGLLISLVQFFAFTGMVYFLGKRLYAGTGTWDEVAYTFSLFTAPLIVVGALLSFVVALLGWIPLIGWLVGFAGGIVSILLLVVQVYYAYLAVQSSMNLRDQSQALTVLILSFVTSAVAIGLVAWIF